MGSEYQVLGDVDELLVTAQSAFVFPEFATVQPVLSDGSTSRNYVLQSGAPPVRQRLVTWAAQDDAAVALIRSYHESKTPTDYTEEDGTLRTVVVQDFAATLDDGGVWSVTCRLLEDSDPVAPGS